MKKLHSDGLLESLNYESFETCEPCLMGKMTRTPFSSTMEQAADLLEIIHTNVCGPMSVALCGKYHYFITFTDDLSSDTSKTYLLSRTLLLLFLL
jgi:hypothetical protein